MISKLKILKYLEIRNHSCLSLNYIQKLINISDLFDIYSIKEFYKTYIDVKKDVKVNNKLSVSINYILVRNITLLKIIDDEFLIDLLVDNEDSFELPEDLELRLVKIINDSPQCSTEIYRYIDRHKNLLKITETNVRHIINDPSFFMSYIGKNINIIKQILLKNRNIKYKKDMVKYIETQGCISNLILFNCIVLGYNKFKFIKNIDLVELRRNICYKHFVKFSDNCKILQKYLVNLKDIDFILKYPEYTNIKDIIGLEISNLEEVVVIYLVRKKHVSEYDLKFVANKLDGECKLLKEYFTQMGFSKILPIKDNFNFCEMTKLSVNNFYLQRKKPELRIRDSFIENQQTSDFFGFLKCEKKYRNDGYLKYSTFRKLDGVIKQDLEIKQDSDLLKSLSTHLTSMYDCLINNKDECYLRIQKKDFSITEVCEFLDIIFCDDFKNAYEILLEILKIYKKVVVEKIQMYLIRILEDGFFEECYFDMIRTLYNRLLVISNNVNTRKNNDIILIHLSKYCKYFNKEIYVANVKKVNDKK